MHTSTSSAEPNQAGLRKTVNVWQAIGLSIALMAPSMAASINPQGTASVVGRAVPLAFALATVGALLIAYSFVRLTRRFSHAGSVYGFVGATIGPRGGIFAGWMLAIAYWLFVVYTAIAGGRFINAEIQSSGIWSGSPEWMGFVFSFLALGVVLWLGTLRVEGGTGLLLIVEGVTVLLILIVAIVIFGKLIGGNAPHGQTFDLAVFKPEPGTGLSSIFLGIVFGFLSFAGFEASATLGEETTHPRRDVPRAVIGTVVFGGVFFVFVTAAEVMGFGTGHAGTTAFVNSQSLMGDLGTAYVGSWIGHVITIGAAISAISCAAACTVGSSRLVFALSRDGAGPSRLNSVSGAGVPRAAAAVILAATAVFFTVGWIISKGNPFNTAVVAGTAGTLVLLIAYAMATLGCMRLLFLSGQRTVSRWEVVIPTAGIVVLGYTLYRNLYPFPVGSAWWGPGLFLAFTLLVAAFVLLRPEMARKAGLRLTADEGLTAPTPVVAAAHPAVLQPEPEMPRV
jgi:amino acid transporter